MPDTSNYPASWEVESALELGPIAAHILGFGERIVLIEGELGTGKTALIKALCHELGSVDQVTSPTFSLVNEYRAPDGTRVFHIDLYRLTTLEEALQIGIEDYLFSDSWCFIEWPELIEPLVKRIDTLRVSMITLAGGTRRIRILK